MPTLRHVLLAILLFSPAWSHSKPAGKGGVGFVLLQALQRERTDGSSLNFYCSHTFQDHFDENQPHFDIYVLKLNPFTKKFESRTRTDKHQSCISEKLDTIYKRHPCLRESFPPALDQAMNLARNYQRHYRTTRARPENLRGYSPELIHYEVAISSLNPDFKFVVPSIWSFLGWNQESGCNFKLTLRQKLFPNDQSDPWIIDSYLLNSNSL